jgi:hypothetical protein
MQQTGQGNQDNGNIGNALEDAERAWFYAFHKLQKITESKYAAGAQE